MLNIRFSVIAAAVLLLGMAACSERHDTVAVTGVRQTHFPGQVTAGGGTSGEVLGKSAKNTPGTYSGGTPGIAGGKGGNTGGTATGGSVQESGQGQTSGGKAAGAK